MASGKISPRQKMINMMYLVLTAMLAMNVSAEILNAFRTVNESITTTNNVLSSKNNETYTSLKTALEDPQQKVKAAIWNPVALDVKSKSTEMMDFLEKAKQEIITNSDRKKENGVEVYKEDDLDAASRLMIEEKKGEKLYNKILQYKKDVLGSFKNVQGLSPRELEALNQNLKSFESSLPIDMKVPNSREGQKQEQNGKTWANNSFHMTPSIAAVTIISKLQNDVKNTEATLADYCLQQIGRVPVVYDKFAAIAFANTTYCMPGEEIEVKAGVGAFNEAAKPQISIGGASVSLTDGVAIQKKTAGSPGEYSIPVTIRFTAPSGEVLTKQETIKYTVGQPSGSALMLDKMNVVYIGLENPITVSSGTGDDRTSVTASGGGITLTKKGPGKYIVKATTVGQGTINITSGKQNTPFTLRVKRVPDPLASIGGTIFTQKVSKGTLSAQVGLVAKKPNDFEFDVNFEVVGFDYVYTSKGEAFPGIASGPVFPEALKNYIKGAKSKDVFTFENVKVKGPDGQVRKVNGLAVTIQ
jgi:gliding motility-associated protein GldM